ncbi:MAG: hypothetical protein QOC73_1772 [Actinomycetota bacterium]|nr:hypothetical protein [Actinomycetota bacterium]
MQLPRNAASRTAPAALVAALLAATPIGAAARDASAATFAFQPIKIQRIHLPKTVTEPRWPGFTIDGRHLLFWSKNELWITGLHGSGVRCLSCGLANDPNPDGSTALADLATPFPDGKRVLMEEDAQVVSSGMVVLECAPSVVNCKSRQLVPVDYSAAEPPLIPPGGAVGTPQMGFGHVAAHAKLSQDGNYVGFSQARSDSIEAMIVGRLEHTGGTYVVTDPRVINPPGPTSPTDTSIERWSKSGALFEFKTFTNGGADATYVEVGGPAFGRTDVYSVNLATGRRTQLAAHNDWDEDNGVSPNGKLLSLFSDRTMHYSDWVGGLVPVRDFINAPAAAMAAAPLGGFSACMGPMWLLPSSGDHGATLAGQPIVDYHYPGVHIVDTLAESSQWSPDGTMIALHQVDDKTGQPAPFLLVAHLTALKPTRPLAPVTSQPGSWAPLPTDYHGAMGSSGPVTLHGPGGGTVTISYGGMPGAISGQWSETYKDYSDNGTDFLNGTVTVNGSAAAGGNVTSHVTMTGGNTGKTDADLTYGPNGTTGRSVSTYNGKTITGPPPYASGNNSKGGPDTACPATLPKKPSLRVKATRIGHRRYKLRVTASVAGVGANETAVDTQPVYHALLQLGRAKIYTNKNGTAIVTVRQGHHLKVTAGDTLKPTSVRLP